MFVYILFDLYLSNVIHFIEIINYGLFITIKLEICCIEILRYNVEIKTFSLNTIACIWFRDTDTGLLPQNDHLANIVIFSPTE